ncbi:MotB family protein [Nitrococcus mobilis]|uniref:Flagellar motor protein n=1 Tax=Nitrococcus mobilis Nb-231 TaxID=314278 RepID=A4BS65_9GAMM|nr:MotB family protein [Nitrococcus mobilis]EAR21544.1 flagellar motor protein [Nitrococcus mobilis Nb-231]
MLGDASKSGKRRLAPVGAPPWMATFADLSTLLLSFFVLLLSFSEMDVNKYKEIAGSMRMAFGVQREDVTRDPPMGTSFVARDFSPGQPSQSPFAKIAPTPMSTSEGIRPMPPRVTVAPSGPGGPDSLLSLSRQPSDAAVEQARSNLIKLQSLFRQEIERGLIEVAQIGAQIVIRVREHGSFPSGSAKLIKPFLPAVRKIGQAIRMTEGQVIIAGHTDNVPIHNAQFRSNWDLSAARAISLLRALGAVEAVDANRITVAGHADTRPIVSNDTPRHRARNRRVEIILVNGNGLELTRSLNEVLEPSDARGNEGG